MHKINLNDSVFIELTPEGWNKAREHYYKLFGVFSSDLVCQEERVALAEDSLGVLRNNTKIVNINGENRCLTKMQLHDFMCVFGKYMYIGAKPLIRGNDVWMENEQ